MHRQQTRGGTRKARKARAHVARAPARRLGLEMSTEIFVMGRAPGRAGVSMVRVLLDLHLADADEVQDHPATMKASSSHLPTTRDTTRLSHAPSAAGTPPGRAPACCQARDARHFVQGHNARGGKTARPVRRRGGIDAGFRATAAHARGGVPAPPPSSSGAPSSSGQSKWFLATRSARGVTMARVRPPPATWSLLLGALHDWLSRMRNGQ